MNNVPRRRTFVGVAALATIAIALSPMATPTRARAVEAAATQRATGVGSQQPGLAWESAAHLRRDLDAMQAAGMNWVRVDFFWYSIQPRRRSSFDWNATDNFVKAANQHHLNVLVMLGYTPAWARAKGTSNYDPPTNPGDFANFARAAVHRYAPMGVHTWEIWNEPNTAMFWAPRPDPAGYARLLRSAYPAIKSEDRNATVVTGGLAPAHDKNNNLSPLTFLGAIYYDGAKNDFDAVGLHPYSYPYAPMYKAPWNAFYNTPNLHRLMNSVGDGDKQIFGTEIGYPTGTSADSVSEQRQADELVAGITAWRKWSFTGPLFIFQLRDSSTRRTSVDTDNMGIENNAGQPKPAYNAIRRKLE